MNFFKNTLLALLFLATSGCSINEELNDFNLSALSYTFDEGSEGWVADFTDYPVNPEPLADSIYRWKSAVLSNTSNLARPAAFLLSCNNVHGDIFMFLKKKVTGFRPNTTYTVVYEVELSSNVLPGQGVILKAGASEVEPRKVIEGGYHTLNIDKGGNTASGENLISFGDIGSVNTQAGLPLVIRGNALVYQPLIVKSNSRGELWLAVGTDAMYSGLIEVYFTRINVVLSVSR